MFSGEVRPDKVPRVFEINARFGGGYPIAHSRCRIFWIWKKLRGESSH